MLRSWLLVMLLVGFVAPKRSEDAVKTNYVQLRSAHGILRQHAENTRKSFQERVIAKYTFLTPNDLAKMMNVFDEFEQRFSDDLDSVVLRSKMGKIYSKKPLVNDGRPDSAFQVLRQRIKEEFPHLGENATEELIYRYRRNLMWTRFKIDVIATESRALQDSSEEE